MKRLKLLLILLLFSFSGFAQTAPWASSPTVIPQTRIVSGSPQLRFIWTPSNIYSLPDTLATFIRYADTTSLLITKYRLKHGALDTVFNRPIFISGLTVGVGSSYFNVDQNGNTLAAGGAFYESVGADGNSIALMYNDIFRAYIPSSGQQITLNPSQITRIQGINTGYRTDTAVFQDGLNAQLTGGYAPIGNYEVYDNKTATQSVSSILYPNWLGIHNYSEALTNKVGTLDSSTTHYPNTSVVSAITNNKQPYGFTVYDKSFQSSLSDFTITGFTPTIDNFGSINMPGGASDLSQYMIINGYTNSDENQDIEVRFVINNLSGKSPSIGKLSINAIDNETLTANYNFTDNTINFDQYVSPTITNIAPAIGDLCSLKLSQRANNATIIFTDLTQSLSITKTINIATRNVGDLVIYNGGASVDIKQIKVTSISNPTPDLLFITDSKGLLPYTPTYSGQRFPNYCNTLGIIDVFGGHGDETSQVLAGLPYIVKYIHPKSIILEISSNDLANSVPLDTITAHYANINTQLNAICSNIVNMLPIPDTRVDQSSMYTFISSNYSKLIDPSSVNTSTQTIDGTHLNDMGSRYVANIIKSSPYLPVHSRYENDNLLNNFANSVQLNTANAFIAPQSFSNVVKLTSTSVATGVNQGVLQSAGGISIAGESYLNGFKIGGYTDAGIGSNYAFGIFGTTANSSISTTSEISCLHLGISTLAGSYNTNLVSLINLTSGISKGTSHNITTAGGILIPNISQGTNNTNLFIGGGSLNTGNWNIYSNSTYASSLAGSLALPTASYSTSSGLAITTTYAGSYLTPLNYATVKGITGTIANTMLYNTPVATTPTTDSLMVKEGTKAFATTTGAMGLVKNPMTSVGDIIYGGSGGTPSRIAGNVTMGNYFLSSIGTGSTSQAPTFFNLFGSANNWLNTQTFTNSYSTSSVPAVALGSGAGTGATYTIAGTNQDGKITVTTGTSPSSSGTIVLVTLSGGFAYPTSTAPTFSADHLTTPLSGYSLIGSFGTSATQWGLISGSTALAASTTYTFYYHCGGY